jgi:hypothetical protein
VRACEAEAPERGVRQVPVLQELEDGALVPAAQAGFLPEDSADAAPRFHG